MKITFATFLLCFTLNFLGAQTDTFMVKSLTTTVSITPNDSWFYAREDYPVKITFKGKKQNESR